MDEPYKQESEEKQLKETIILYSKKAMFHESTDKQKQFFEKYGKFFPDSYSIFKERLIQQ